jgi:hypothetical protein
MMIAFWEIAQIALFIEQCVTLKRRFAYTRLYGAFSQKIVTFTYLLVYLFIYL